jgi:hypothetical protein
MPQDVGDQGKAAYTSDGLDCAESRFNAPEILNVQETGELVNSLAADVWSFGMIVLQARASSCLDNHLLTAVGSCSLGNTRTRSTSAGYPRTAR